MITDASPQAPTTSSRQGPADPTLLHGVAVSDPDAWRAVLEGYRSTVRGIARRHRFTPDDTDDVEQLVWLQLLRHADRIREPECLPGWLATTTRRECLRMLRERHHGQLTAEGIDVADEDPDAPYSGFVARERATALHTAIGTLPPRQRDLLRTLMANDFCYRSTSQQLDMPMGSIGPIRARALRQLLCVLSA